MGVAILAVLLYAMFRFSIGVALPQIGLDFGLDSVGEGLLVTIPLAATASMIALAGYLADRFGEKIVLISGVVIYSAGLLLAVSATDHLFFLSMLTINGLGSGLMLTPLYSLVGRMVPARRGFGISLISGLYNTGGFVGPIIVSLLIQRATWRYPFFLMGVFGLVLAAAQSLLVRPPVRSSDNSGVRPNQRSSLSLLRERNLATLAAAILLADLAFLAFITWTVEFMTKKLGMTEGEAGLLFGVAIGVGGLGVLSTGFLFDRIGGKKSAIMGGAAATAFTGLLFLQTTPSILVPIFLLSAGFFTNTFWNLLSALAQVSVEESRIGTATGVVQNVGFIGAVVGPYLVGSITKVSNLGIALITSVTIPYLIYTVLMLAYNEKRVKIVKVQSPP